MGPIIEAACWACAALLLDKAPIAIEAVKRIDASLREIRRRTRVEVLYRAETTGEVDQLFA